MHTITIITVIHTPLELKIFISFFAIRLTEEECEETFRNGIIKLAGFCTAPYGAAVPEMRWNSQPLGSPLRQLCSSRNYVCCLGEINLFFFFAGRLLQNSLNSLGEEALNSLKIVISQAKMPKLNKSPQE